MSDYAFSFSIEKLKEYVQKLTIEGIAITNHNTFNLKQYEMIRNELSDMCTVLPGIEINVGKNNFGHLRCIVEQDDIEDFVNCYQAINDKITSPKGSIILGELY